MVSYKEYYDPIIRLESNGLKLVLGGTGLGKTSGIRQVVIAAADEDRQLIYCANRIQLLNEMRDELKGKVHPDEVVHLPRDLECVQNALKPPFREQFNNLFDDLLIYAPDLKIDPVALRKNIHQFDQATKFLDSKPDNNEIEEMMQQKQESSASEILNFFKAVLSTIDEETNSKLIFHPIIQILFPFVKFKYHQNPKPKLLLLTVQKSYLGFFDGQKTINLAQLKNYVVFLDEFDFLESDLIDLICKAPQIDEPFLFVASFYKQLKLHKLPSAAYLVSAIKNSERLKKLRETIENEIIPAIDEKNDQLGFPDINHFTSKIKKKPAAIFQTNRTIVPKPLFLSKTDRSFELVALDTKKEEDTEAIDLFNTVSWATAKILFTFKEIELLNTTVYEEMLSHCFPQSFLAIQVKRIAQLPTRFHPQLTRFGNLLEEGYGLYEIDDLQQITDPEEVKFRHYAIHTTPEKFLLSVTQKNLVFGLSATADISRLVRHFNLEWLQSQLDESDNATFYELNQSDTELIDDLNRTKWKKRKENQVIVDSAAELASFALGKDIREYVDTLAEHDHSFVGDPPKDDPSRYRRKRVEHFFATLLWIANNQDTKNKSDDTHLLFLNSFVQIKYIFEHKEAHDKSLFTITKPHNPQDKLFSAYNIHIDNTDFIVIFYDAKQAKYIFSSDEAKENYHQLFWKSKPVILVTQYNSAGNGVNLQYYPSLEAKQAAHKGEKDQETDFRNIHLLEAPYFFFEKIDKQTMTAPEIAKAIKENIWYWAKLYEANVITEGHFFVALSQLRDMPFNKHYRHTDKNEELNADSLKNRLSTYIQALGRIERVWAEMPTQRVFLEHDVLEDFATFCTSEHYEFLRAKRSTIISSNLQRILEQIPQLAERINIAAKAVSDQRLARKNRQSIEAVHDLLRALQGFREGDERCLEAKTEWINLRKLALEHRFTDKLLTDYAAIFKTEFADKGIIYTDDEMNLYPPPPFKRAVNSWGWRLNAVYDAISQNKIISKHFSARGYELEFSSHIGHYFTPYFYQAILVGAIGEEAIWALLHSQGVLLDRELPDPLFELADLKVQDQAWYIDCKNYSETTLLQFPAARNDPAYRPKLNEKDFEDLAKAKFQRISEYHAQHEDTKLIYINLVSSTDRIKRYWNRDFEPVENFDEAQIILVQGIISREEPDVLNRAFKDFVNDYRNHLY